MPRRPRSRRSASPATAASSSRRGRPIPSSNPLPGHFEQDPEDWWRALTDALRQVAAAVGAERIAALSIAHQRESFTLLDEEGSALIPAILWLDERSRRQVDELSGRLGREQIRDWSGKPPDPTPALYALAWLEEHRPEDLRKAAAMVDTGGFLIHRLTGRLVTSLASADPLGLVDIAAGRWHPDLVAASGLQPGQLPGLVAPGSVVGEIEAEVAAAGGLSPRTLVVAGAGDGQAMGLGMGIAAEGRTYLSLGSGVVSGAYRSKVVTSDAFRTLVSPTGTGFMLETVLRSGMQLVDWIVRLTASPSAPALEAAARKVAPGSEGVLVLPYWSGVMSPYWDGAARGAIVGLSLGHAPATPHARRAGGDRFRAERRDRGHGGRERRRPWTAMIAAGGGTNRSF